MELAGTKSEQLIATARRSGLRLPREVWFGSGRIATLGEIAGRFARGRTAFLLMSGQHDEQSGLASRIATWLAAYDVPVVTYLHVDREPTVDMVDEAAREARRVRAELVIGVGGGSVIDCAKATAAMAVQTESVGDYLEGVGRGLTITHPPLALIAVPTAAGTGAEMTRNAVIGWPAKGVKRSLRDDRILPVVSLIDPELTLTVPAAVTAAGGMDAVTQLLESCISIKRRPETTGLAWEGLRLAGESLLTCFQQPDSLLARQAMALASMLGGICLANSGLGLVHGVASGLGGYRVIPHGLICGILLPHALRYNRTACEDELAAALAAFLVKPQADRSTIDDGIAAIEDLQQKLRIPPDLRHFHLSDSEVQEIAALSMGSSMSGNPRPMTVDSVTEFLRPLACISYRSSGSTPVE